ncbi:MAG: hypothetical protein GTO63_22085 [Anaerolineae bacterium]|nr:hypothetical protein [Anaerolineae bacterium]NIN97470.1 hypothetical protein [Anaerolineae bacterium]NIQ80399.1 hypothetical protein [Anaerolineae bacterium]
MKFSEMGDKDVREYLDFLLRQYRLTDAFWFLAVEDTFGTEAAVKLNEDIWTRMGGLAAKEIQERFQLEDRGVARVLEALSYFPWTVIVGYDMEESEDGATIRVPHCPPQAARLRAGRGEFPCKSMHLGEFTSFAKEIDERVEVRCVMAPPDPHPDDLFCEWELRINE